MKKLLTLLLLSNTTIFAQSVTPNVADGTPAELSYEVDAIALTIVAEAGGEGEIGMSLVADVIHTRMIRRRLTAYEVVAQPKQFVGFMKGDRTHRQYPYAVMLAEMLTSGLDPMPNFSFDQFRAFEKSPIPSWAIGATVYKNHVFFNEEEK